MPDTDFAGELFVGQITPTFSQEFCQLFCEPVSHAQNLAPDIVPHMGIVLVKVPYVGLGFLPTRGFEP